MKKKLPEVARLFVERVDGVWARFVQTLTLASALIEVGDPTLRDEIGTKMEQLYDLMEWFENKVLESHGVEKKESWREHPLMKERTQ